MTCDGFNFKDLEESVSDVLQFNCNLIDELVRDKKCRLMGIVFAELAGMLTATPTNVPDFSLANPSNNDVEVTRLINVLNVLSSYPQATGECPEIKDLDACSIEVRKLTNIAQFQLGKYDTSGTKNFLTVGSGTISNELSSSGSNTFAAVYQIRATNQVGEVLSFFIHSGIGNHAVHGSMSVYQNVLIKPTACFINPSQTDPVNPTVDLEEDFPIV